jgi:hypothetical protein
LRLFSDCSVIFTKSQEEPLFVVVFQNYLSYSALAGTDEEAVAGGFNDRSRDDMKVIYVENSLDLSEEPSQKPEISIFDEGTAGMVLIGMPGIEKRVARFPQFYSRIGFVHEFRPLDASQVQELLEKRISSVRDYSSGGDRPHPPTHQGGRISYCSLFRSIFLIGFEVGWIH